MNRIGDKGQSVSIATSWGLFHQDLYVVGGGESITGQAPLWAAAGGLKGPPGTLP